MRLNEAQNRAVDHRDGPCLVIAGPGSGKTTVITHRIRSLIEKSRVNPGDILVITFTKAAAEEMERRFREMTDSRYRVTFGTFHSVFFRILRLAYNYDAGNIIRENEQVQIMRELTAQYCGEAEDLEELGRDLMSEISLVKNERIDPARYYSKNCPEEVFRKVYREYEARLRRMDKVDFDDMLLMTLELFEQRPDVLAAWQRRYPYILIDEFQDINRVQYQVVKLLAQPRCNLFVVGDDDQSIYRFRGSKPELMLGFEKDFAGTVRIALNENYRSVGNIVKAAARVIGNNRARFEKKIVSMRESDEKVLITACRDPFDQNVRILEKMEEYRKAGYAYSDMAILYRTTLGARMILSRIMEQNMPFQMRDKVPNLYEHWICRDLCCYLRLMMGDRSRRTFLQVMNRPKRYIERDAVREEQVAFDVLREHYAGKDWMVERIERLEFDLGLMKRMAPAAAIRYIRKSIDYESFLAEYAEYRRMRVEDLIEILDLLEESAREKKTVEEWFYSMEEYTRELQEKSSLQKNPEGIHLSTMHAAKGLEYPIVFLIGCNEGVTPHRKAVLAEDIEEERRLFYVAMTRAKDHLHILYPKEQFGKELEPSRFVTEIMGRKKK